MEASPHGEANSQPDLRGRVRLEAEFIRDCIQAGQSVDPEKAFMIYVMQNLMEANSHGRATTKP